MAEEQNQSEIQEGKISDFIDGKLRPDNELEQIRQNLERTVVEEYRFEKSDVGVDVRIKVQDGTRTVARKIPLAIFREGATSQDQDNIHVLIQTANSFVQPTDTKNGT